MHPAAKARQWIANNFEIEHRMLFYGPDGRVNRTQRCYRAWRFLIATDYPWRLQWIIDGYGIPARSIVSRSMSVFPRWIAIPYLRWRHPGEY